MPKIELIQGDCLEKMMIEGRKIPPFLKKYKKYEKDFIQIEQSRANTRQIKRVDDEL